MLITSFSRRASVHFVSSPKVSKRKVCFPSAIWSASEGSSLLQPARERASQQHAACDVGRGAKGSDSDVVSVDGEHGPSSAQKAHRME